MTADLCEHGDIRAACLDCLTGPPPGPRPRPAPPEPVSRPFRARFDGDCAACTLPVHVGQLIVRLDDDTHRHDDCDTPT